MIRTLKDVLRLITPPLFIHLINLLRNNQSYGLSGDYRNWENALAASTGYDSELILEKTRISLLKVRKGEAVYERDSMLFDEIQYAWPVLAGLMWVAARCSGRLNVLDFGGSLGSAYFQNRVFLSTIPEARWNIIEQPAHVQIGKTWFEDDRLHFYEDIADCLAATQPNVVLFSGVLQYLEHPFKVFDQILTLPSPYVIIDRTPFWAGSKDRLCIQTVPPSIYPATYPSWIFSAEKFRAYMKTHWKLVAEFDGFDKLPAPVKTTWKGMIATKREETVNHG